MSKARSTRADPKGDRLRKPIIQATYVKLCSGEWGIRIQGTARVDETVTVTKKNGTATERNRIRRRLRELVKRLDAISLRPHSDYVLVGRRAALNRDFATMLEDLRSALHRLDRQPSKRAAARPE